MRHSDQRWKLFDLWWLLALPFYIVVGTIRHEASHAIVAMFQGAHITSFTVLPSTSRGNFMWGSVRWMGGDVTWVATAAPYLCDLATFAIAFAICRRFPYRRHWFLINVAIMGLVSPLVNSAYNYLGVFGGRNDVAALLTEIPPGLVHGYFLATMAAYLTAGVGLASRLYSESENVLDKRVDADWTEASR